MSYETTDATFYDDMKKQGWSFDGINQIQWETIGLEKGYVVYNMCQHWVTDTSRGLHGNISPTGRMEVHPQSSSPDKWIYFNNLFGDQLLNRHDRVVLGGEAQGQSVGWLLWWIAKLKLPYATSVEQLVSLICEAAQMAPCDDC